MVIRANEFTAAVDELPVLAIEGQRLGCVRERLMVGEVLDGGEGLPYRDVRRSGRLCRRYVALNGAGGAHRHAGELLHLRRAEVAQASSLERADAVLVQRGLDRLAWHEELEHQRQHYEEDAQTRQHWPDDAAHGAS